MEHKLKNVDAVEFNHQNGQVTFMGKKEHYFISNEGVKHLMDNDGIQVAVDLSRTT